MRSRVSLKIEIFGNTVEGVSVRNTEVLIIIDTML